jgi:hypothetical protein
VRLSPSAAATRDLLPFARRSASTVLEPRDEHALVRHEGLRLCREVAEETLGVELPLEGAREGRDAREEVRQAGTHLERL